MYFRAILDHPATLMIPACVIGAAVFFFILLPAIQDTSAEVILSTPVGGAASATWLSGSFFSADRSVVTTDKGTFTVVGTFQLIKGNQLVVETYKSSRHAEKSRRLCDKSAGVCKEMAD